MNPQIKIAGCLPDEIITEIFTKLPAKSLCRFKCVSKPLLYLIEQDPSFVEKSRKKTLIHCEFQDDKNLYIYSIDTNGVPQLDPVCIRMPIGTVARLHHCHGLMCYLHKFSTMCLLNLATQERVSLPGRFTHFELYRDPVSKKYKILGWTQRPVSDTYDFYVLTLDKDLLWRPLRNTLEAMYLAGDGIIVNGGLYWRLKDTGRVVSFDLVTEEFRVIDPPRELDQRVYFYGLIEFEGSLILIELGPRGGLVFDLWMLKDVGVGSDWILMKSITLPIGIIERSHYVSLEDGRNLLDAKFSSQSGELIIMLWFQSDAELQYDQSVYLYSFLNGQFKKLKTTEPPVIDAVLKNYEENCVSLKNLVNTFDHARFL